MPRKCCTFFDGVSCTTNYKTSTEKSSVFRFPNEEGEKQRWISSLPNILPACDTKNLGVCEKHWPVDYPTISVKGKRRPANPPFIFGLPKSFLPQTYYSSSRDVDTRKVSSEART